MEKKLRKLELIEVPMSELEQEALDEILAGWSCESFFKGPPSSCDKFSETNPCGHCAKFSCPTYEF